MEPGAQKLYNRAMNRLSPEERERERSRDIPYPLSLHALARHFWETGTRQGWLPPNKEGKPLLMAVSGGGDSVAMLWLFRVFYEGPLVVAHVEHGIRGRSSEEDAAFVRELAGRWALPFAGRKVSVPTERDRGESLETAARRVRHRELVSLADSNGAWGVATGHNRDDLAETALFHILRGTGIRGGVGIPERNGPFFRPVLGLRRGFLREILHVRGLEWREDETNGDTSCTRNLIRLEILPLLERRVNAEAAQHIADFAEDIAQWRDEEEGRGKALLESALMDENGGGLTLRRKTVAEFSPFERRLVLREAGRRMGLPTLSRRRMEEFSDLIRHKHPFTFQWKRGAEVIGRGGMLRWSPKNC